jgi:hypothetical protein
MAIDFDGEMRPRRAGATQHGVGQVPNTRVLRRFS